MSVRWQWESNTADLLASRGALQGDAAVGGAQQGEQVVDTTRVVVGAVVFAVRIPIAIVDAVEQDQAVRVRRACGALAITLGLEARIARRIARREPAVRAASGPAGVAVAAGAAAGVPEATGGGGPARVSTGVAHARGIAEPAGARASLAAGAAGRTAHDGSTRCSLPSEPRVFHGLGTRRKRPSTEQRPDQGGRHKRPVNHGTKPSTAAGLRAAGVAFVGHRHDAR